MDGKIFVFRCNACADEKVEQERFLKFIPPHLLSECLQVLLNDLCEGLLIDFGHKCPNCSQTGKKFKIAMLTKSTPTN